VTFESRNPATGELIESFPAHDSSAIATALREAEDAFQAWRETSFTERSACLHRAAAILRTEKVGLGRLMAREMGKPVVEGEAEAEKCAWVCEYYAEHAPAMLAPEPVTTDAARSYIRFDPLGTILAVMPWNFPFWQVFRFAAPALMAGNTGLLKHASNVPRCGLTIEEILHRAGVPRGAFRALLLPSSRIEEVLASPVVKAATLTGSEPAGAAVASLAGRLLKKTVLELGGSDPFIVLDDADPLRAASWAARARTVNSGQSCIAAKRFLVMEPSGDRFVAALRAELEALPMGDPLDHATRIGPLAREDLRRDLHSQVERTVRQGATLVTGGTPAAGAGAFYPPTLLDRVRPGMPAFDEETFGPVAAVVRVSTEDEAVTLANATPFGLGASIWSGDAARAERLAPRIEAGAVFVNGVVKSDPRLPFGGIKLSGYGRELATFGIREFVNDKSVWVAS
jgi:succinate-semialdehyde dehydrogenase / glutarate-semialdehyde dehydrogenase